MKWKIIFAYPIIKYNENIHNNHGNKLKGGVHIWLMVD